MGLVHVVYFYTERPRVQQGTSKCGLFLYRETAGTTEVSHQNKKHKKYSGSYQNTKWL